MSGSERSHGGRAPAGQRGPLVWALSLALCGLGGFLIGGLRLPWTTPAPAPAPAGGAAVPPVPAPSSPRLPALALGANTIADIAEQAAASVVNIDTSTSVALPDSPFQFFAPGFDGFEFYFGQPQPGVPRKFESRGSGTGVIIRADGYILTNNHVVKSASEIKVRLNDKRTFKGRVVGRDRFTDLALVKIDAQGLPVARLGTSKSIRPGDWAIAIGSPLGLDHTVTLGIVSALGRSLDGVNNVELIQTDAAINPGNSGGPLLNIRGEVIGINTAIRSDAQNIGFAVPVDVAQSVVSDLLEHGAVSRPYLGIYMQEMDEKLARSLGLAPDTAGVVVIRVGQGSPAQASGLLAGDVIQRIDGKPVGTAKEIQNIVRSHKVGDVLNMLVLRNGSLSGRSVKIGEYPQAEEEGER